MVSLVIGTLGLGRAAHWNSMARKGRVRAATGSDNEGPNDDGKKIAQVVPQQPPADDGSFSLRFPELPSHFELKRSSKSGTAVPMKSSGVGLSQRKKPAPLTLPVELGSGDARSSQSAAKSRAATAAEEGSGEEMAMNELFPSDSMLDVTKPTAGDGPTLAVAARRVFVGSTETNVDDNGHRYVGLRNQAMTCYLNSLIQTLYMTPEFRNAIYKWKFLGKLEDEGRSIACQLQKLFLLLQTSDKESLETKDLTASFGWSGCEVYDQHDVQELCRVMFDALEHKWRNTSNSSLIQDLYRHCLNCQRESVKPDTFLDLPLAINHGGTGDAYKSVEEALHAFVKPEILDGVNQYSCGNCGTNQNALKGLRFTQFPYLLTIQLKRFDFDRNTFHRIKLNDKMTFPMLLNLNEFVHCPSKSAQIEVPKKMSWANAVASNRKAAPPPAPPRVNYVERAEQQSLHIDEEEVEALVKKEGPCLYELFSVMVHQGSAAGGHYFAYIKNMDQDAWFCFNDCSVTAATIEDIHRTFGGSSGGWSSSNTNAYMLMYRKIDRQRNAKFVKTVNLPSHLGSLLQRWEREEEEKLERKRLEETLVNVIVLYNGGPSTLRETQCTLRIPYTTKLRDVFVDAMLNFAHPDQLQSKNDVRLLKCGSFMFSIMCSFTSSQMEEMTLAEAFPNCASKAGYRADVHLMLDCKPHTMPFFYEIFEVGSFTLNVVPVNVERAELFGGRLVQFSETETVRMMKAKLAALYSEPPDEVDKLRLVLDKGAAASPTMILLDDDDLRSTFILTGTTVTAVTVGVGALLTHRLFVDAGSPGAGRNEDRRMDFIKSRMFKILERKKHSLSLKIRLPNSGERCL
ncbi:unnamed protein product [Toxocara canis]|uniref:Ubiquitin carboxyl-terminal hydrolase n=1 Tax=Toxocara canis TaxID=6265 RepID=A0A183UYQ4_TOXCA|nr:unnamed protein product [Toxocara canis]